MDSLPGIKQGATFEIYLDSTTDGAPDVFSATELQGRVGTRTGVHVSTLAFTTTATPGRYYARVSDTSTWPVGVLLLEVARNDGSKTWITSTLGVPVMERVK